MASAELIILNILKIIFLIIGGHIALTKIVPMLEDILSMVLKPKEALEGLTSLISILILILVGTEIIKLAAGTEVQVLSYLSIFTPALNLFMSLIPYISWILGGLVVILGLSGLSKK